MYFKNMLLKMAKVSILILFIVCYYTVGFAETFYDSFDSDFIDLAKWQEKDHSVREVNNGKLRLNEYGTTNRFSTYLHLTAPVTGYLEAKIAIQSGSMVMGSGTGFSRIGAYFYNSERGPGSYNAYVGNVWSDVRIVLGNDNSLRARASIWKTDAPDQSSGETLLDQEFSMNIEPDIEYRVSMELIGSELIFRCDDQEIIYQIQTPVYEPYGPYHHLCTRIYPETGSAVSLKASFDDVYVVRNVLYDSFDSNLIDSAKWEERDHIIREIYNGKLRMGASGLSYRYSNHIHPSIPVAKYMEVKTTIQNTSQIIGNGTACSRIGAYFYNSERGPGNYNGYVGNVWSELRIVLENDNSLKAKAYLWKATLADQSAGETIFEQAFTTPIDFETEYLISIELIGSEMIYKCNGEKITYQISSQLFDPFQPYQHLTCRIHPEEGSSASMMALFDDVTFSKVNLNGSVDINGDGHTNLMDAILALRVVSNLQSVDVQRDADVNGDGSVGIEEAIVILQKVGGLR